MNRYLKNLNRIEFVVTLACTGNCKHCSEGAHNRSGTHISAAAAAQAVREISAHYTISSMMTFGGEPLLYPETVYAAHTAAAEMHIPNRQLITNGFFSKNHAVIKHVAENLSVCGVNDILLSVDAFHQETIPLEPVKQFALECIRMGLHLRAHPAWLVKPNHSNPYNIRTHEILAEFASLGISASEGNIIFPSGNALKYLQSYFDKQREYPNPYTDNPQDIRSVCISANGDLLNGNIYNTPIAEILDTYTP